MIPGFAFSYAVLTLSLSSGVKRLISFTGTFSTLFASTYWLVSPDALIPEATVMSLFSAVAWILSSVSNLVPDGNSNVTLPFEFRVIPTFAAFSNVL